MKTNHELAFYDSRALKSIGDETVDLVVTSPPYPMIEMWDDLFGKFNPEIKKALKANEGHKSFDLMHRELDKVWKELDRVVKPCRFVCINIGDATRSVGDKFRLYSNHSRITSFMNGLSFETLPIILWRKGTNAPNKFMGSGMLPAGAYVTLEHEYILVFRKNGKRVFKDKDSKKARNESAYFWEERNQWFSDLWDLAGVRQALNHKKSRNRSAAYPFELAYRLINMYSIKGDLVLDPFLGTGTTLFAAMASARNSIGVEKDKKLKELIASQIKDIKESANRRIKNRIQDHLDFVKTRKGLKYLNIPHSFPVMTRQEREIRIEKIKTIRSLSSTKFSVGYDS